MHCTDTLSEAASDAVEFLIPTPPPHTAPRLRWGKQYIPLETEHISDDSEYVAVTPLDSAAVDLLEGGDWRRIIIHF